MERHRSSASSSMPPGAPRKRSVSCTVATSSGCYGFAWRRTRHREVAEDVVASTFEKAWRRLEAFDPERGRFVNWVLGIAANELADGFRRSELERRDRTVAAAYAWSQRAPRRPVGHRCLPGRPRRTGGSRCASPEVSSGSEPSTHRRPYPTGNRRGAGPFPVSVGSHIAPRPTSARKGSAQDGRLGRERQPMHRVMPSSDWKRAGSSKVPPWIRMPWSA